MLSAGTAGHQRSSADDDDSPSKRRRRSEDRDVAEAKAEQTGAEGDGADSSVPAAGVQSANGHSLSEANGDVPPEAAFWSALEDAKDKVSHAGCFSSFQGCICYRLLRYMVPC